MASIFQHYGPVEGVLEAYGHLFSYEDPVYPIDGFAVMPAPLYGEIYNWCIEQFDGHDRARWTAKRGVFRFRDDADAMHFKLRWY